MRVTASVTLARQWAIIKKLRQRRWYVATLARTFGVNKGTIQRDLYTLMDAGLPVRSERTGDRRNTTRWWIEGDMPW